MEKSLPITREDWDQHIVEDDQRGAAINELKLAMFGDPESPDTVKVAVMPTMTRLNTYLDGIVMLFKFGGGAIMVLGAGIAIAKNVGWL